MGTRSELDSWGEAHRRLWEKLRRSGRRVEVVAVAWEQVLLDRAGRRLRSWVAGEMSEDEKEALMLRQAMAEADWGHHRTPWRIRCRRRENPPMGSGRPGAQGPRNDRRFPPVGVTPMPSYGWPPYKGGVAQVGGARFWQLRICTIRGRSPRRCGQGLARESAWDVAWNGLPESFGVSAVRRRARVSPPPTARRGAAREGEEVEGATPGFLALVRPPAGGGGAH